MNREFMFSSKTDDWATPKDFFEELNKEFDFNLDPCSSDLNHKCAKYYTKADDGLSQNWGGTEFFAIRLMGEIYANGLKNVIERAARTTLLS